MYRYYVFYFNSESFIVIIYSSILFLNSFLLYKTLFSFSFFLKDCCSFLFFYYLCGQKPKTPPPMSRKFNTNKFIKDVLNDRYALVIGNAIILDSKIEPTNLQRTAIQSVVEVDLWPSFGAVREMAGFRYTLSSCLSKLRSSIEAGKKQLRVWLQYSCGVTEMLLYPSFSITLA